MIDQSSTKNIVFSIIIPVYKVEKYIRRCVDSVLSQSFNDFEIILVDDGSPDNCPAICDEYANIYHNVKTIHKKNGGLSDARNEGIKKSNGLYLVFVDSDDWIETNSLENIYVSIKTQNFPDILTTRLINYSEKDGLMDADCDMTTFFNSHKLSKKSIFKWEFKKSRISGPAQRKICRRDFILNNNLYFALGRLHEDNDWTARIYYHAKTYGIYTDTWYYHFIGREEQITNNIHSKNIIDTVEMGCYHEQYWRENPTKWNRIIHDYYFSIFFQSINLVKLLPEEDLLPVTDCLEDNKHLLSFKNANRMKYFLFVLCCKTVGIKKAIKLLRML